MDNSWKTAITRTRPSAPVSWLEKRHRHLTDNPNWTVKDTVEDLGNRILDYGCGKGFDADYMGAMKYDPHFFPDDPEPNSPFDIIFCTYVLNVMDRDAQREVLGHIDSLSHAGTVVYCSVRRDLNLGVIHHRGYAQYYVLDGDMRRAGYHSVHHKKNHFEIYVKSGYGEY